MRSKRIYRLALSVIVAVSAVAGHAGAGERHHLPTATLLPIVPGTVETRSTPFISWFQDLSAQGYVEEEYAVSGSANIYGYQDNVAQRPEVRVLTPDVPYTTRILVRRPVNPEKFRGTVLVEVLNATAGWDGDPVWYGTFPELIRSGAIWVGVSTKPVTVNFMRDSWGRAPWPTRNASRYAGLSMPAFGQVWDMLTQIGTLLRTPDWSGNPLRGFDVERLIMVGYSQSAGYQVTYANSFHNLARLPDGRPVYDGYQIETGGASAKDVTGASAATENLPAGDARNLVQVDAYVVKLQTQTEIVNFPSYPTRQSSNSFPLLRSYEIAGGSHVDGWRNFYGGQALVRDLGLPPSFCPAPANPYNPIRTGLYEAAALRNLVNWIKHGSEPPPSRFIEVAKNTSGNTVLAHDANGNVLGGVRPPEEQAPLGVYLESNIGPGFCGLYGGYKPFDAALLHSLYPSSKAYVEQFEEGIDRDVKDRYLLREDAHGLFDAAKAASSIIP